MLEKIEVFGRIECANIMPDVEELMSKFLNKYWQNDYTNIVTSEPFTLGVPGDSSITLESDPSISISSGTYWYHGTNMTEKYWYNNPIQYEYHTTGGIAIETK